MTFILTEDEDRSTEYIGVSPPCPSLYVQFVPISVSDSDAALCCDKCNQWIHVSCEPNVSLDFYNDLVSLLMTCGSVLNAKWNY